MGQVSILEDIEKALQDLRSLKGRISSPPTEIAIAAQSKRLGKEEIRLRELQSVLTKLADALKNRTTDPQFKQARRLLNIQDVSLNIERLKQEKAKLLEDLKQTKTNIKSIPILEKKNKILQQKLDKSFKELKLIQAVSEKSVKFSNLIKSIEISLNANTHPTTLELKQILSIFEDKLSTLDKALNSEKAKVKRLQGLLSSK